MNTPAPTATYDNQDAETPYRQSSSRMGHGASAQAEFDRFVTGLLGATERPGIRPRETAGPPSIDAETIHRHALDILDREGAQALTLRRMADDLKISTRTLYKRIGNRDSLIRRAVEVHYHQIDLDLQPYGAWDATAQRWCRRIYLVLRAHPYVTLLSVDECSQLVDTCAAALTQIAIGQGIPTAIATACCTALINVAVNAAIRKCSSPTASEVENPEVITDDFNRNVSAIIDWILAGICATSNTVAS